MTPITFSDKKKKNTLTYLVSPLAADGLTCPSAVELTKKLEVYEEELGTGRCAAQ